MSDMHDTTYRIRGKPAMFDKWLISFTVQRKRDQLLRIAYYFFNIIFFYLIISRSLTLPIQGDEAGTYLRHAIGGPDSLFNLATANNHFLNTLLIKLTTYKAGFSEFAIRLPTVGIYFWFFFFYVPNSLYCKDWGSKLLFSGLSLFPYYFHEYASMARGYVISSIFACCTLNEIALSREIKGGLEPYSTFQRIVLFASLSTLASIITFPLFVVSIPFYLIAFRSRLTRDFKLRKKGLALPLLLALGTVLLTIYTFLGIKLSGVGTINAPPMAITDWLLNANNIVWQPVSATAHSYGSQSSVFAMAVTCSTWITFAISTLTPRMEKSTRLTITSLFISLILLYFLALTGNYPIGRGLIPYWLPICYVSFLWLSGQSYVVITRSLHAVQKTAGTLSSLMIIGLLIASTGNLINQYEARYVNEMRPFYYQYKSLMYYSRNQSLQCLSYGDINDEVLKFYFLNPNGPVPRPEECPAGGKSQFGFMPFSLENKEPQFPTP